MKFFKCISKNASLIQEKRESAIKRLCRLNFKQKKKRSTTTMDCAPTPSHKGQGLSVRLDLHNDVPSPNVPELVVQDSTPTNMARISVNDSRPSVQNTSCGTDSFPAVPAASVCAENNLTSLNRTPVCIIRKYFDSMAECNTGTLTYSKTDESYNSFVATNGSDSHFEGSSKPITPRNNRRVPHIFNPYVYRRFPSSVIDKTHVDIDSMGDNSVCADYLLNNVEDIDNVSMEESSFDIDIETISNRASSAGSTYLDPVAMGANLLFQDVDFPQTVEKQTYRPARHTTVSVTVVRGENGFGFSFGGESPRTVTRVDRDSPADQAGIRKGDLVLTINRKKLTNSASETVADFVKVVNPEYLILELKRDYTPAEDSTEHHRKSYREAMACIHDDSLYASTMEHEREAVAGPDVWSDHSTTYLQDMSQQTTDISKPSPRTSTNITLETSDVMAADLKHKIIHSLMSLEEDYINFMQYGIEEYSRPLRCILSRQQHTTIFQNVEKLVKISEYHVKQMQDRNASINADNDDSQFSNHSLFVYLPALVYEPKMMCQAYEVYAQGFERSKEMVKEIKKENGFSKFVKRANNGAHGHLSVSAFLNKPILHIQELYKVLKEVLTATPKHSHDFVNLQTIIDQVSQCVKTMAELCSLNINQDVTSSQINLIAQTNRSDKTKMTSPLNIQLSALTKSMNIIRIQDKLIFAPSLQDGHSCVENMPLIYEGNVKKFNKGSWISHKLLLFSELILVASQDLDGFLFVSDSPILIEDLAGLDISREHEFVLHLQQALATDGSRKRPSACHSKRSGSTIILRVESVQDKFLWKSLLEQRVPAVTGSSLQYVIPAKPI